MLQAVNNKVMLSDEVYSAGKKLVQVILPAASTAYFALGNIWGFPAVDKVTGSLAVVAVFIGACLGISSRNFDASGAAFDGNMVGQTDPESGKTTYTMVFHGDPEDIVKQDSVRFKVVPPTATSGNAPSE
jgi:hypothetical protein